MWHSPGNRLRPSSFLSITQICDYKVYPLNSRFPLIHSNPSLLSITSHPPLLLTDGIHQLHLKLSPSGQGRVRFQNQKATLMSKANLILQMRKPSPRSVQRDLVTPHNTPHSWSSAGLPESYSLNWSSHCITLKSEFKTLKGAQLKE